MAADRDDGEPQGAKPVQITPQPRPDDVQVTGSSHHEPGRLPLEVVLPIRWTDDDPERVAELAHHLRFLSTEVDHVTVVDGSPEPLRSRHAAAWHSHARIMTPAPVEQLWPDQQWLGLNGKVVGAWTGVLAARSDLVILADDDARHTRTSLAALAAGLQEAALVRPVTVYDSWPWQARWDGARTLLNVAFGAEWPGTLAVRRAALVAVGGWCPDVLFENLELWRTLEARGHPVLAADVIVRRCPPSARHFWSQRVRQAYDDLAQPGRLAIELALLPALVALARRPAALAAAGLASTCLAALGRRRLGRSPHVPASVALWAPAWVLERAVCVWAAVGYRALGGVPYCGTRMPLSAHSLRALRRD
jgi:hypothetical protein